MNITVLYLRQCPNYKPAVELVRQVLAELGIQAVVHCVEVRGLDDAERHRFFGSPTIHVDGVDVEPRARDRTDIALSCRLYDGSRAPSRRMLEDALREATGS